MAQIQNINNILKFFLTIYLSLFSVVSYSQSMSENDIRKLAEKVNQQLKGVDIGNGVVVRGCISAGRMLIYQYDVPENWYPPENIKSEVISNLRNLGVAQTYFKYQINVNFIYYKGNSIIKRVSVKSNEFSTFNFELGEYLSVKDHPKAKNVNLKLKVPKDWEVQEGVRPNIVKKFVYKTNTFLINIRNNVTFFSRNEAKEIISDEEYAQEYANETSSFLVDSKVLNSNIVTIDTYPALVYTIKGNVERSGYNMKVIMKIWIIFYEDKIVFLQSAGLDDAEFRALEQLYTLITNSVVFPDQYN